MNLKKSLAKNEFIALKTFLLYSLSHLELELSKADLINIRAFYYKLEKKIFALHFKEQNKKFAFSITVNEFIALDKFYPSAFDLMANTKELSYEAIILTGFLNDMRLQYESINLGNKYF